jgi:hypothetical protein
MTKPTVLRSAQTLHLLALAIWMGSVAMSGLFAAIIFPTMRTLDPTLAQYPLYTGDHSMLAAGRIASKVFLSVDTIQFVCSAIAMGGFIVMLLTGYSLNTLSRVARSFLISCALAMLSYHLLILMPGMYEDLRAYWEAAALGNTALADTHKDAFAAMHSSSSRSIGLTTLFVLLAFVFGVWTAENPPATEPK